ncbi:MAG: DinB family protein [Synechococcus sp.]
MLQPFIHTGKTYRQTRVPTWILVTHMFNHQTHPKGQLTTLLAQLGYESGITDLPWMPSLAGHSIERPETNVTHPPQ